MRTGPQLGRPTVDFGPLQQQGLQTLELFGGQAWRRTEMRFGRQTVGLSSHCEPTVNGSAVDAIGARDNLRTFATIDRLHRTIAPPLEFRGSSKRSTHIELERQTGNSIHWQRSW
jgi:hypothetical protein